MKSNAQIAKFGPKSLSTDVDLEELVGFAKGFASRSRAPATLRAYAGAWDRFVAWCRRRGFESLPASPETVALHITELAVEGKRVATIAQVLAAIAFVHQMRGQPPPKPSASPELGRVWEGIRRASGIAPQRKAALTIDQLRAMVEATDDDLRGLRDRALVLLGFAGAFRRSELVALDVEDVEVQRDGLLVRVRRSKTDQEGAGAITGVRRAREAVLCPVRAVEGWLAGARLETGALFRHVDGTRVGERLRDRMVAEVVKDLAHAVGLDPEVYAGHSLRAGLATEAARAGVRTAEIMRQGRWASARMVDEIYVRPASALNTAAASVLDANVEKGGAEVDHQERSAPDAAGVIEEGVVGKS